MKLFPLFIFIFLFSCQKEEQKPANTNAPEKVLSIEDEIGSFTFVSNIEGIEIKGDRISRSGDLTLGEDLKIVESSSSKVIDQFLMQEWGKVGFKLDQNILHVYPIKNSFEMTYTVKDKKVQRKSSCQFNNLPDGSRFDSLIAQSKEATPDWETIVTAISDLAKSGDKKSYNFFMNPDLVAKTILKNSEDGGTSIVKILKFMGKNGCTWD